MPHSLEVSALAVLTAFETTFLNSRGDDPVGMLEFGARTSCLALFNKGNLALVRLFDIGTDAIVDKVKASLGVDWATAAGIVQDGAFDITQPLYEALSPLVKQITVSRDFVERREDCRIRNVFVSGGLSQASGALNELASMLGTETAPWSPLDQLSVASGAIPEELVGQEWRFTAAIGACLATLEQQ